MQLPASVRKKAKRLAAELGTPTFESRSVNRIYQLKWGLVLSLYGQRGAFWEAVARLRTKWKVQPQVRLPSKNDQNTTMPLAELPRRKSGIVDDRTWYEALGALRESFVPSVLSRAIGYDFLGACVMCDPPGDGLLEFSEFDPPHPRVFWPATNADERAAAELPRMIAPPIEFVWKRGPNAPYEDDERFGEYRIVVDEYTKEEDVVAAFRAIKAAYGYRNPGGKPPIDKLTAVQCAVLYDDHNGTDPEDRRVKRWSHKKLAANLGLKNERSAEEHVKRGRELRENFRNP